MRERLYALTKQPPFWPKILDVGGRKSHCTIGISGEVIISDLPRKTSVQHALHLGLNNTIVKNTKARRSNLKATVYDDMTHSGFRDAAFHYVMAVEVLEHVEQDEMFIREICRILKPNGIFLMSTPNGDFLKIPNPDHKRHYQRLHLEELLKRYFRSVNIDYAIIGGKFRNYGLQSFSKKHPLRTVLAMIGNVINGLQSSHPKLKTQAAGTRHLIATCKK